MDVKYDYSGLNIGQYILVEKLGRGNFGAVYSATDLVLNSQKAIKIMNVKDPMQAKNMFEEAAIPYKCSHNNIVKINGGSLELFDSELHFVIDMDLVNGGSLEDAIRGNMLSVVDSLSIIKSTLFGLQHAHNQNIIHRDIKPANILLDNNIPKLSDFGLASEANQPLSNEDKWYMTHVAPEIKKTLTPTIASDIYAMGITLFRAVNCISNWNMYLNDTKNIQKRLEDGSFAQKAIFNPIVPTKVVSIVRKACKANSVDRYKTAAEMRDAIEKLNPFLSWKQVNEFEWHGNDNKQIHVIQLQKKKSGYEVQIKINGRKVTANTKAFELEDNARNYLYEYIKNTTLH
ncbi:MAG: serine/threonine-protein kinase [Erysipelotrichaceae bacterium]